MRGLRWSLVSLMTVLTACAYSDGDPPAAPRFDGAPKTTSRATKMTLAGTAEFGAKLALTRDPAFAEGEAPGEQTADPYTARFSYGDVPLARGKNVFTLVATDDAGNVSEPGTLEVEIVDGASALELTLPETTVVAGTEGGRGALRVVVDVQGVTGLAGRKVQVALSGVSTATAEVELDGSGHGEGVVGGLVTAGTGTAIATFGATEARRAFTVVPGPAAALELRIATGNGTPATSIDVAAGGELEATAVVKDGTGNVVQAPVALAIDAPGALVSGLRIANLVKAGEWRIIASPVGVPTEGGRAVSGAATVRVTPGAASKLVFDAPESAVAGEAFGYALQLEDSFGNAVAAGPGQTLAVAATNDAQAQVSTANKTVELRTAGTRTLAATLAGGGASLRVERTVRVAPATAESLSMALGASQVTAAEDASIAIALEAKDRFQNVVAAPIALSTTAPGFFEGTTLKGLTKAGSYDVVGWIQGTALNKRATFSVAAGAPASLAFQLGSSQTTAGTQVPYTVAVSDAFGNAAVAGVVVSVNGLGASEFDVDHTARRVTVFKASATPVVVQAALASGASTPAPATASLVVSPGAPASIALSVPGDNSVVAGSSPELVVTVKDARQNVITNPALTLAVVPKAGTVVASPGPIVTGGRVVNLRRVGEYLVTAQVIGTSLAVADTDPEATITVRAAPVDAVSLELSTTTTEVGSAVSIVAAARDEYGNAASESLVVSVRQGSVVVLPALTGASWTPAVAGLFTVRAQAGSKTSDVPVTVRAAEDRDGPTIAFQRPASEPTIGTWPAGDRVDPGALCAGATSDRVSVSLSDASLVSDVWVRAGGVATGVSGAVPSFLPVSSMQLDVAVCGLTGAPTRGEVLLTAAATDLRGNYRSANASWCLDPTATGYAPANPVASRCAVLKDAPTANEARALASNEAGDLVIAREVSGAAIVNAFRRSGGAVISNGESSNGTGPASWTYGLGSDHALTGWNAPTGTTLFGATAYTAVTSATKAAIVRTRSLLGSTPTTDAFVEIADDDDRFGGVTFGLDGKLYATWHPRAAGTTSKLYRVDGALDAAAKVTTLPASAVLEAADLRLTGLCAGTDATTLYATATRTVSGQARAALAKIDLRGTPTATVVFTDSVDGRTAGGCAATNQGIAITLSKTGTPGVVGVVDAAGTLSTYMNGFAATGADLGRAAGITNAGGYVFAASTETAGGSLLRFARAGGF